MDNSTTDLRRLGARIAWGPPPSADYLDFLEGLAFSWLCDQDDPFLAALGGAFLRVADLERRLAGVAS